MYTLPEYEHPRCDESGDIYKSGYFRSSVNLATHDESEHSRCDKCDKSGNLSELDASNNSKTK